MAVEYDTCTSSSSTLTDISSIKENKICKNLDSRKKRRKSYHYICVGALANMVQTQIQGKYAQNDCLYFIGSKYMKDIYRWAYQYKYKDLLVNDFLKPFLTSIALFAVGIKLTSELVAWKVI